MSGWKAYLVVAGCLLIVLAALVYFDRRPTTFPVPNDTAQSVPQETTP